MPRRGFLAAEAEAAAAEEKAVGAIMLVRPIAAEGRAGLTEGLAAADGRAGLRTREDEDATTDVRARLLEVAVGRGTSEDDEEDDDAT